MISNIFVMSSWITPSVNFSRGVGVLFTIYNLAHLCFAKIGYWLAGETSKDVLIRENSHITRKAYELCASPLEAMFLQIIWPLTSRRYDNQDIPFLLKYLRYSRSFRISCKRPPADSREAYILSSCQPFDGDNPYLYSNLLEIQLKTVYTFTML